METRRRHSSYAFPARAPAMLRRGQRCVDGARLSPGIHASKWAFRVYNNTSRSVPRVRAQDGPETGEQSPGPPLRDGEAAIFSPFSSILRGAFITGSLTSGKRHPANQSQTTPRLIKPSPAARARRGVLTRQEGRLRAGADFGPGSGFRGLGFLLLFGG